MINAQRLRDTDPRIFLNWKALVEEQSRQKNSGSLLSFFSPSPATCRALSHHKHSTPAPASRAGGASVEEQKQEDHCSARNRGGGAAAALEASRGGGREVGAGERGGGQGDDVQSLHPHSSTQGGTLTRERSNKRELADDAPQGAEEQLKQVKLPRHSLSLSEQRLKELSEGEKRVQQLSNGHTSTAGTKHKSPATPSGKVRKTTKTGSGTSNASRAITSFNASKPISSFFTKS